MGRQMHRVFLAAVGLATACAAESSGPLGDRGAGFGQQSGALTIPGPCDLASTASIAVPSQCATIQAAIDHAKAGAVITVAAGAYSEALFLNKSLTIQGAGAALTRIQAPSSAVTVLQLGQGGGGTVSKLTLSGGAAGIGAGLYDSSFHLLLPANLTLSSAAISGAPSGMLGSFAGVTLVSSSIAGCNTAAMNLSRASSVTLSAATLASSGSGLVLSQPSALASTVAVNNSTFKYMSGNALSVTGKLVSLSVAGSSFANNGTGLYASGMGSTGSVTITGSNAVGNKFMGFQVNSVDGPIKLDGNLTQYNGSVGAAFSGGVGAITVSNHASLSDAGSAISVVGGAHPLQVLHLAVNGSASGLALASTGSAATAVNDIKVVNPVGIGIDVFNTAGKVDLSNYQVSNAAGFGIRLWHAANVALGTGKVDGTKPLASTGKFGDGVGVFDSHAVVTGLTVTASARAGLSLLGCTAGSSVYGASVEVHSIVGLCNGIDMDIETSTYEADAFCGSGDPGPAFVDLSGTFGAACASSCAATAPTTTCVAVPGAACELSWAPAWQQCKALSNGLTSLDPGSLAMPPHS